MKSALILLLAMAATAHAGWSTPPWPSQSYPVQGIAHTTNTAYAFRERDCAVPWSGGPLGYPGAFARDWPGAYPPHSGNDANVPANWSYMWTYYFGEGGIGPSDEDENYAADHLYRSQRWNLMTWKAYYTNICGSYVDISYTNAAGNFTDYLNANSGNFPMLTPARCIQLTGAPSNYFTSTPQSLLFAHSNGWRFVPSLMNLLVVTTRDVDWTQVTNCLASVRTDLETSVILTNMDTWCTNGYAAFDEIVPPWRWDITKDWWEWSLDLYSCTFYDWPAVDWQTILPCDSTVAASGAPLFTAVLDSDINFHQEVQYDYYSGSDEWCVDTNVSGSFGNTQNFYTVRQTNRTAYPMVQNLCYPLDKRVQFYVKVSKTRTDHAAATWWLHDETPETHGCQVTGELFNAALNLSATSVTAIGTCDTCYGPTNRIGNWQTSTQWLTKLCKAQGELPCTLLNPYSDPGGLWSYLGCDGDTYWVDADLPGVLCGELGPRFEVTIVTNVTVTTDESVAKVWEGDGTNIVVWCIWQEEGSPSVSYHYSAETQACYCGDTNLYRPSSVTISNIHTMRQILFTNAPTTFAQSLTWYSNNCDNASSIDWHGVSLTTTTDVNCCETSYWPPVETNQLVYPGDGFWESYCGPECDPNVPIDGKYVHAYIYPDGTNGLCGYTKTWTHYVIPPYDAEYPITYTSAVGYVVSKTNVVAATFSAEQYGVDKTFENTIDARAAVWWNGAAGMQYK